jgi:hypothetical protein
MRKEKPHEKDNAKLAENKVMKMLRGGRDK